MKKVLIIDDDEGVRLTLNHVLSTNGYKVWTAADGEDGVAVARDCRPEIVLTDLLMPRQDGLECIRTLRQEVPDLKIVAISGGMRMGHGNILDLAVRSGADRVLAKPFDLKILLELLEQLH